MDQMDAGAAYSMSPRRVTFEYKANGEARSAAISGDALQLLEGGRELAREEQLVAAYGAHWLSIHALAAEIQDKTHEPVFIRAQDLPRD